MKNEKNFTKQTWPPEPIPTKKSLDRTYDLLSWAIIERQFSFPNSKNKCGPKINSFPFTCYRKKIVVHLRSFCQSNIFNLHCLSALGKVENDVTTWFRKINFFLYICFTPLKGPNEKTKKNLLSKLDPPNPFQLKNHWTAPVIFWVGLSEKGNFHFPTQRISAVQRLILSYTLAIGKN